MKKSPHEWIAGLTIFVCLLLIALGKDGTIRSVLLTTVGALFGYRAARSDAR